jgi:lysophospholipase L1-like esterase
MSPRKSRSQSAKGASPASKNRFERHPRLTLSVIVVVLIAALVGMLELGLRLAHERLHLTIADKQGQARVLRLREWPPGMVKLFAPPDNRIANDPIGPVEPIYELGIDEAGFIKPSIVHDQPDLEIAFLGGSTTECLYVRPFMRFPYLAGRMLEARSGLKINALNTGKSGNHTMHAVLDYLGKVAARRPRFVVLMGAANDIGILNKEETYWNNDKNISLLQYERTLKGRQPIADFLERLRESTIPYTHRLVRHGLDAIKKRTPSASASRPPERMPAKTLRAKIAITAPDETEVRRREQLRTSFEPALRSFVRLAKAWGSEPVLMTEVRVDAKTEGDGASDFLSPEALRQGNFDRASFTSIHNYANAIVRHVALTEGAILIDLVSARHWTRDDVYDGLHLTETGSRHVAEIIEEALAPRIAALASATPR